MKNIKYILPLLLLFSCKKEVTQKEKTCNCYERHEYKDAYSNPNGLQLYLDGISVMVDSAV